MMNPINYCFWIFLVNKTVTNPKLILNIKFYLFVLLIGNSCVCSGGPTVINWWLLEAHLAPPPEPPHHPTPPSAPPTQPPPHLDTFVSTKYFLKVFQTKSDLTRWVHQLAQHVSWIFVFFCLWFREVKYWKFLPTISQKNKPIPLPT